MRIFSILFMLLLPFVAAAQNLPDYQSTTVNDYAGLLDEAAEGRISKQLETLRGDTGIEMTVLTLKSQSPYWPNMDLEPFATALFNHWGIGDADRNDGILVMVLQEDRAMRIELGSGYGSGWNRTAQDIIDRSFLPAFRGGAYADGIEAGVTDTIESLARPFHQGAAAPSSGDGPSTIGAFGGIIGLFLAFAFRQKLGDMSYRFRRCPQCGSRTLTRTRNVLESATKSSRGKGEMDILCSHCNYHHHSFYSIPMRSSSSSGGSFGGGSSSGGGASGRW